MTMNLPFLFLGIVLGSLFGSAIALAFARHYFEKWAMQHIGRMQLNIDYLANCINKTLPH